MPCPWFRGGLCTSPRLREPSSSVVSPQRCGGGEAEYKACRFYTEPVRARGLAAGGRGEAVWPPIHVMDSPLQSGCQFFELARIQERGVSGYTARCRVLGRLLTTTEAAACSVHWEGCPFRRLGLQYAASG